MVALMRLCLQLQRQPLQAACPAQQPRLMQLAARPVRLLGRLVLLEVCLCLRAAQVGCHLAL
jgi:hypothetical protein